MSRTYAGGAITPNRLRKAAEALEQMHVGRFIDGYARGRRIVTAAIQEAPIEKIR